MKRLDVSLQRRRAGVALAWVPEGAHVLDVGCANGALFELGRQRIASGVGIDPAPGDAWVEGDYERRTGHFPDAVQPGEQFDAIVMLAVVEHVPDEELKRWSRAIPETLRVGGRLIITTPSPLVDHILRVGIRLRLLDGMEAHQHHGFDPEDVPRVFSGARMRLAQRRRFQFGLNNLFVFAATA